MSLLMKPIIGSIFFWLHVLLTIALSSFFAIHVLEHHADLRPPVRRLLQQHQPHPNALIVVQPPSEPLALAGLSTKDILIIVLGYRRRNMEAQTRTFVKHFPTVFVPEEVLGHCVFCGTLDGGTPFNRAGSHFKETFFATGKDRFDHRPMGWYCGRKLQALQQVLVHITSPSRLEHNLSLPAWIGLIDDDTFVNAPALLSHLASTNSEGPLGFGGFYEGGAGFFLPRGVINKLLSPGPVMNMRYDPGASQWKSVGPQPSFLDMCVDRALGGPWCYLHDDHLMGTCFEAVGDIQMDKPYSGGGDSMVMICPVSEPGKRTWLANDMITCHYVNETYMEVLYGLTKEKIKGLSLSSFTKASIQALTT